LPDGNRGLEFYLFKQFQGFKHQALRDGSGGFYRTPAIPGAADGYGGGEDPGGIAQFRPGIGFPPGTAMTGDGISLLFIN
jgi:hypothetical protein